MMMSAGLLLLVTLVGRGLCKAFSPVEISTLVEAVIEKTERLDLCTNTRDYEEYRAASPALIKFLTDHMERDMDGLAQFVTPKNAVYRGLVDDECRLDSVDECPFMEYASVNFRRIAPSVFAGLVGVVWLLIFTPIAVMARCKKNADRCCPVIRPRELRPGAVFLILLLFPAVFLGILAIAIVGGDSRVEMYRGMEYGLCAFSQLAKSMVKEMSSAHATGKKVMAKIPSTAAIEGVLAPVYAKIEEISVLIDKIAVMSATAVGNHHSMPIPDIAFMSAKAMAREDVLNESVMASALSFGSRLDDFVDEVEGLANFIDAVNGVDAYVIDETFLKPSSSWTDSIQWLKEGAVTMFVLSFVPLLFLCYIVFVSVPGLQVTDFSRYFTRHVRTRGPFAAWFTTCGFAGASLSIAAVIYFSGYYAAAGCLIARDVAVTLPNLEHLVWNKFEDVNAIRAASGHFRECLNLRGFDAQSTPLAQNVVYRDSETLYEAIVARMGNAATLASSADEVKSHKADTLAQPSSLINLVDALANFAAVPYISSADLENLKTTEQYAFDLSKKGNLSQTAYTDLYYLAAGAAPSCTSVQFDLSPSNPISNLAAEAAIYGWTGNTMFGLDDFFTRAQQEGLSLKLKSGAAISTCSDLLAVTDFDRTVVPEEPFTAFLMDKWTLAKKTNYSCLSRRDLTPCMFPEFANSIASSSTSLGALGTQLTTISFSTLDTVMDTYKTDLNAFSTELLKLNDQVCRVEVADMWNHTMWTTCLTAIPGLLGVGEYMLALGCLAVVASLMMFAVWRRIAINNANASNASMGSNSSV